MVQVYTRWIRVQINELDRAKETVTRLADCDDIIRVWRVGQALVWIQFSGAAALHFFCEGCGFSSSFLPHERLLRQMLGYCWIGGNRRAINSYQAAEKIVTQFGS
jgi:hypothetical protein